MAEKINLNFLVQVPGYQHGTIRDCQKPFKLEKI